MTIYFGQPNDDRLFRSHDDPRTEAWSLAAARNARYYQILLPNHRILARALMRFSLASTTQQSRSRGGGDQMLHSRSKISANRSIKLAVAAAAMALLAGCAVTMPLRPLATFSQSGRADFACRTGAKCSNGTTDHRVSYRRSQLVGGSKIDDDPPDFIGDQDSTPPIRTQNE